MQIDTPELDSNECYAKEAKQALISLLRFDDSGKQEVYSELKTLYKSNGVVLEEDPLTDQTDKYNRKLRYIYFENFNINLKLVEM